MRRAKSLSEVWIHFERQKIDNKYMAKCKYCQTNFIRETRKKKNGFFNLGGFFPEKKTFFFPPEKNHLHHYSLYPIFTKNLFAMDVNDVHSA